MKSLEAWRYAIEELAADPAVAAARANELMDRAVQEAPTRAAWECGKGCDHGGDLFARYG